MVWWTTLVAMAWATPCAEDAVGHALEALVGAETALARGLDATTRVRADELEGAVACLDESLPPALEARLYRAIGAPREGAARATWWERAIARDPTFRYAPSDAPPEVAVAWLEAQRAAEAKRPSPRPEPVDIHEDGVIRCGPPPEKVPLEVAGSLGLALGVAGQVVAFQKRKAGAPDATAWTLGATGLLVVSAGATGWGVIIHDRGAAVRRRW